MSKHYGDQSVLEGFFFHLLYQKNENCTLRQKLLKHTWYACN